jgi:hypothetical protein
MKPKELKRCSCPPKQWPHILYMKRAAPLAVFHDFIAGKGKLLNRILSLIEFEIMSIQINHGFI